MIVKKDEEKELGLIESYEKPIKNSINREMYRYVE